MLGRWDSDSIRSLLFCKNYWRHNIIFNTLSVLIAIQTQHYSTNWAWRTPSLVQIVPSILCFCVLTLLPESPRW